MTINVMPSAKEDQRVGGTWTMVRVQNPRCQYHPSAGVPGSTDQSVTTTTTTATNVSPDAQEPVLMERYRMVSVLLSQNPVSALLSINLCVGEMARPTETPARLLAQMLWLCHKANALLRDSGQAVASAMGHMTTRREVKENHRGNVFSCVPYRSIHLLSLLIILNIMDQNCDFHNV